MIYYIKTKNGFQPATEQDKKKAEDFKAKVKDGEKIAQELHRGNQVASLEQLKKYRGSMLPCAMYYLDDLTGYGNNRDAAHNHLKLLFCFERRMDLASVVTIGDTQHAIPFSLSLGDCSQKNRNEYFKWLEDRVSAITGKGWDDSINQFHASS